MNSSYRISLVILFLIFASPLVADDWPAWRHDRSRSAVSSEKLQLPLEKAWTFRSRQARRAPKPENPTQAKYPWVTWYTLPISAAGDSLFFTSADDGRIACLDAASGKIRWEFLAGCGVNRVPTYWKGKLYAGSSDGHVYCLNAKTGQLVWKFKAAPKDRWFLSYSRPMSVWPVRTDVVVDTDPAIHGGKAVAYFGAGVFPHDGTFLYAVDAETGKTIWRNATHAESGWRASMAPAGYLYVTEKSVVVPRDFFGYFSGWGTLISFNRATGLTGGYSTTPPVIGIHKDNLHYLGNYAFKIEPGKKGEKEKRTELWRQDIPGRWTDLDSAVGVRGKRPVYFRWDPDLSSIAYAGGVVYQTAFVTDAAKGMGTGIYARNATDGKVLWSTDVAEQANQVIVANGRLFASTRQGTIYCFAPKGAKKHGVIEEPVEPKPFATAQNLASAADTILKQTGVKDGYAIVLDCESGSLAYQLAKRSNMKVLAAFRDADKAAAARKAYSSAGMHVSRILAYHHKKGEKLPFTSYIANLIVSEAAVTGKQLPIDAEEMNRLLKPIRGIALIGGEQSEQDLKKWVNSSKEWNVLADGKNQWARRVRPRLKNAGGWTHPFGDAGQTGCSHDGALKPPLGIYWYGDPQLGYAAPGALMIDGVFLLCEGANLVARDQYTGRKMWQRAHGRTDTVCDAGSVFMRYLEVIVRIDPSTGRELTSYKPPVPNAKWLNMAAAGDGKTIFLVMGGKDADKKDWRSMMGVDVASGNIIWSLGGPGKGTRWGGWNAIGDGFIYKLGGAAKEGPRRNEAIAEMRAHLKATDPARLKKFEKSLKDRDFRVLTTLDAKTGKILYEHGVDITNCGGKFIPQPAYGAGRYARHYNPGVSAWVMARKNVVVFGTQSGADKGWRVWPSGAYKQRGLAVHDGATGKLLWNKPCNYRTRPVIVDETIYAEPWGYDLRTGKRKQRTHPITGKMADWAWCRSDKQCGTFSASTNFLFGRSLGVGYHDLLSDNGLYTFFHSRMSCSFDAFTGGGMMVKPPNSVGCRCSWSLPFTIAMGQVKMPPATPQGYAQPGSVLPVKHLHLDVGANGTRRDHQGNLWIPPTPGEHFLLLRLGDKMTMYEGGGPVQRSSLHTRIEDTDVPFVFASAVRGIKSSVIPVTGPKDGQAAYTIRLGFSGLPGDKPGQRVFDVKLNGETVLTNFDIVKETGKPDHAIWKEFTRTIKGDLLVELVAKTAKPSPKQMPLLNGVIILRK